METVGRSYLGAGLLMLSREQFAQMFEEVKPGLGLPSSPLWIPEEGLDDYPHVRCEWFVCVRPKIRHVYDPVEKSVYWSWCQNNLNGHVRCFSSNTEGREEWWGFTDANDVALWLLKWGT